MKYVTPQEEKKFFVGDSGNISIGHSAESVLSWNDFYIGPLLSWSHFHNLSLKEWEHRFL